MIHTFWLMIRSKVSLLESQLKVLEGDITFGIVDITRFFDNGTCWSG